MSDAHYIEVLQTRDATYRRSRAIAGKNVRAINETIEDGREATVFPVEIDSSRIRAYGLWTSKPAIVEYLDAAGERFFTERSRGHGYFILFTPDVAETFARWKGIAVRVDLESFRDLGKPIRLRVILDVVVAAEPEQDDRNPAGAAADPAGGDPEEP